MNGTHCNVNASGCHAAEANWQQADDQRKVMAGRQATDPTFKSLIQFRLTWLLHLQQKHFVLLSSWLKTCLGLCAIQINFTSVCAISVVAGLLRIGTSGKFCPVLKSLQSILLHWSPTNFVLCAILSLLCTTICPSNHFQSFIMLGGQFNTCLFL